MFEREQLEGMDDKKDYSSIMKNFKIKKGNKHYLIDINEDPGLSRNERMSDYLIYKALHDANVSGSYEDQVKKIASPVESKEEVITPLDKGPSKTEGASKDIYDEMLKTKRAQKLRHS